MVGLDGVWLLVSTIYGLLAVIYCFAAAHDMVDSYQCPKCLLCLSCHGVLVPLLSLSQTCTRDSWFGHVINGSVLNYAPGFVEFPLLVMVDLDASQK